MASSTKTYKVGVIIGSQRVRRVCPQIAKFVLDVIQNHHSSQGQTEPAVDFALIDTKDYPLPLEDISTLPSHLKEADLPGAYSNPVDRAWSATIAPCDAFVFVSPQYNWGIPAPLKNALDHIFHEWTGKAAMVVTYGGNKGSLGAAQLTTVLKGMFVRVPARSVGMSYGGKDVMMKAIAAEDLHLDARNDQGLWAEHRQEIAEAWEAVKEKMLQGREKPAARSIGLGQVWSETVAHLESVEEKMRQQR